MEGNSYQYQNHTSQNFQKRRSRNIQAFSIGALHGGQNWHGKVDLPCFELVNEKWIPDWNFGFEGVDGGPNWLDCGIGSK